MIPFFVKVDTAPCEWFSAARRPDGKVGVAIQSDGSVGDTTLTLEQMRQVLALFPELTQEVRNAALEEAARSCEKHRAEHSARIETYQSQDRDDLAEEAAASAIALAEQGKRIRALRKTP